ncbi:hypothetical protein OAL72_00965 [bacterium]|nr:hypothetical protein [bacterium]
MSLKLSKSKNSTEQFCLQLIHCESEKAVEKLLRSKGYWDDEKAWKNYGDNENNFSIIGNQQSRPEAALVEKIINSVDSVLMANCLKDGIDPECSAAPKTMKDAVAQFLCIPNGSISNLAPRNRTPVAENIKFIATGGKAKPNYIILDKGEGQTALTLPKTILSLGKSNKLRIPFVQGKFNMGGSGVLQFCGRSGFQLIVTRRDPQIADSLDPTSNDWAVTIVRRFDPKNGTKSSCYKYLAPNGEILHFNKNELDIAPGKYPNAYQESINSGTFIKLFEYVIPGLKTNILLDLYNKLSLLMPEVALPIRLLERRVGYNAHSYETTLAGLRIRLEDDRNSNLEENFPASASISIDGQIMDVRIMAFKPKKRSKYTDKDGVIFEVNGQNHGSFSTHFFNRKSVNMGYIHDSILVEVDCTKISGRAREDLFMSSRDRLRNGPLQKQIERELEHLISNHSGLKALRAKRREEAINERLTDSKPLADMLTKALKSSPTLSQLFGQGKRLINPFKSGSADNQKIYVGQRFPSVFKLAKEQPQNKPKLCPKNQTKFRVQFITDAENDYFSRSQEPGSFSLKINGLLVDTNSADYSINLWRGKLDLNINVPKGIAVDQMLEIETEITDQSRFKPFKDQFYVKFTRDAKKSEGGNSTRKPPASDNPGDNKNYSQLSLPEIIDVPASDWDKHDFDEYSALKVLSNGEGGYDFYINVDNAHLLREQKFNKSIDPKIQLSRFKYGLVIIGLAMLNDQKLKESETNIECVISKVTRCVAPVFLPLIQSLAGLDDV